MANSSRRATVLVITAFDDERQMYSEFLRRCGFHIVALAETDDVVKRVVRERADAVLLRVRQRGARDGIALTRELRQDARTCGLPIVLISTYAEAAVRDVALAAGCSSYLLLPAAPDEVAATLRQLLAGRVPGDD